MNEDDDKKKLLNKIVAKRREMKITPLNMSQLSKMNKEYVHAIENGEFGKLPLGYEKMFLRTYLRLLKFDNEQIEIYVNEFFEESLDINKTTQSFSKEMSTISSFKENIDLVQVKKFLIWLPALIVLIVLIFLVIENQDSVENPENIPEITMEESVKSLDTLDNEAANIITFDDSLKLTIEPIKNVFFLVQTDSQETFKVRGRVNNSYLFKAKNTLNLYASNGGHIRVLLNDSNYGVLTNEKTRINFMIFTKDGIKSKGLVPIEIENAELSTDTSTVE